MQYIEAFLESYPFTLMALAIAFAFGYVVAKGTGHLSEDNKARLSLYLQGDYKGSWAQNFCDLFDSVFGHQHFSFKTFWRSALASVLAVSAIYLLLGPILGQLGTRTQTSFELVAVLGIGAAINIVPDYVSLWQTRWILSLFHRVRGPFLEFLLLLLDLLVSALIIWLGVAIYHLARGQDVLHIVDLVGVYSPFAIFFYSTFLTSLLAWTYCATSWFVKGFSRLSLNRLLNTNTEFAGRTLAFSGGTAIFVTLMLVKPVLDRESVSMDAYLCDWFPEAGCPQAARVASTEDAAVVYLITACENGVEFCIRAASEQQEANTEFAFRLWSTGCGAGISLACLKAGGFSIEAAGVPENLSMAFFQFEKACENNDFIACNNLGSFHYRGLGETKTDYYEAAELFAKACGAKVFQACTNLGEMFSLGRGQEIDKETARGLYKNACQGGHARGCTQLGILYELGQGGDQDLKEARLSYRKGCDGQSIQGCTLLGHAYISGYGLDQPEYKKGSDLLQKACEEDDFGDACSYWGEMFENGLGMDKDPDLAKTLFERA